jgi:hypothetical protein
MATIAIRQAARLSATTEQQKLLTLRHQFKGIGTSREAIRKLGRTPAAAQQYGIARLDPAHLRQDWRRLTQHKPAPPQ